MSNITVVSHTKNTIESHFNKISSVWYKTAQSILETGKHILDAEKNLKPNEIKKLKEQLVSKGVMSSSTISKLQQIAKNAVLCNPEYQNQLPPSYESLYILSRKEDVILEAKIVNHEITATTERKELSTIFRNEPSPKKGSNDKTTETQFRKGSIRIETSKINEKEFHTLVNLLKKLQDKGIIKVTGDILNEG